MDNEETRHYAILYQDEKRVNYTVYESVDLASIADVYADMVAFENMMHTFVDRGHALIFKSCCR